MVNTTRRIVYLFSSNWHERAVSGRLSIALFHFLLFAFLLFLSFFSCFVSDTEWVFKWLNGWFAFKAPNQLRINWRSFERNYLAHKTLTYNFKFFLATLHKGLFYFNLFSHSLKSIASNRSWLKFSSCWHRIIFEIFLCQSERTPFAIFCFIFSYLRGGGETMRCSGMLSVFNIN